MAFWQKSNKFWAINVLGLMLLLIKLIFNTIPLGYFLIFCLMLWQITFVIIMIGCIAFWVIISGIVVWIEDRKQV